MTHRSAAAALALMLIAGSAWADDGRVEISQASIDAAGGYPFAIDEPGSYVLTSNLTVPSDVSAIVIGGLGLTVTIDLNGFEIAGPSTCSPTTCTQGGASGIGEQPFAFARATIFGGTITGFSGSCIALGGAVRIRDARVSACGRNGITVGARSVVTGSIVSLTGESGIVIFSDVGTYGHNTVGFANQTGGSFDPIVGGVASAGNSCDVDGARCSLPRRRFYLTQDPFRGDEILTACATGYHAATLWEILEVSALEYDFTRGYSDNGDQGAGPPTGQVGWIRTGGSIAPVGTPPPASITPGIANCRGWTNPPPGEAGSLARLAGNWAAPPTGRFAAWEGDFAACSAEHRVWCVSE